MLLLHNACKHTMCHASDAPDESEAGTSVEYSESHGSEDDTPGHSSRQGLNEVKDWGALDFSIVRDAALRKVSLLLCCTPLAALALSPCTTLGDYAKLLQCC